MLNALCSRVLQVRFIYAGYTPAIRDSPVGTTQSTFQIISDIYYLRESPATFPVCGGFVFFHREYMYESV
ncbi:TPA: hypothetical protein HL351_24925 [Escherichia coli]|nr:hypothetical protein [Escherichia coli]